MIKQNLVAHNSKGSADKIYLACVRVAAGQYTTIGKWGRCGRSNLQQQVKLQTGNESAAVAEQRRLFEAKLKTGYIDIESPAYSGPLTMSSQEVRPNLEGGGNSSEPTKPRKPKKPRQPKPPPPVANAGEEVIVECVNNAGMEDKYDAGIEYVGERHSDVTLLMVYDKFGVKQECFADRFKEVPE